jgi:hypothetical protein
MAVRAKIRPIPPFSRSRLTIVFLSCLSIIFSAIFFPPRPSVVVAFRRRPDKFLLVDEFPVTFLTIPKPQRVLDQIRMSQLVLTVWLSCPNSHVIMFSSASEYDPLNQILPLITARFGPNCITFELFEGLQIMIGAEQKMAICPTFRC